MVLTNCFLSTYRGKRTIMDPKVQWLWAYKEWYCDIPVCGVTVIHTPCGKHSYSSHRESEFQTRIDDITWNLCSFCERLQKHLPYETVGIWNYWYFVGSSNYLYNTPVFFRPSDAVPQSTYCTVSLWVPWKYLHCYFEVIPTLSCYCSSCLPAE